MSRAAGRRAARATTFVLSLSLLIVLLTSCGTESNSGAGSGSASAPEDPSIRFGPENYNADPAVLSFEVVDDVGQAVVYRETGSLERVIARSPEVVLLAIVQPGQTVLHRLQPWLEQLAADEAGSLVVILATNQAADPFLSSFEQAGWPSFFVIQKAAIKLTLYGFDENNQNMLEKAIRELSKK